MTDNIRYCVFMMVTFMTIGLIKCCYPFPCPSLWCTGKQAGTVTHSRVSQQNIIVYILYSTLSKFMFNNFVYYIF